MLFEEEQEDCSAIWREALSYLERRREEEKGTVEERSYGDFGGFANTLDTYVCPTQIIFTI